MKQLYSTIRQQRAAKLLTDSIKTGSELELARVLRDAGYTPSSAAQAGRIIQKPSFQRELAKYQKELVPRMEKERARALMALSNKDLDVESLRDLNVTIDTLTRNIQLLSGGATENQAIIVKWVGDDEDGNNEPKTE
jgi:hypothetical protein